jgi:hypothetical protein
MENRDDTVYCPICDGANIVRNGVIRGVQRYLCKDCSKTFVVDFKHRYPRDAKLLHLIAIYCGASEEHWLQAGPTVAAVERWQAEARDLAPWFVRALADHLFFILFSVGEEFEQAYGHVVDIAAGITGDSTRAHIERFMDLLDAEFIRVCKVFEENPDHDYYAMIAGGRQDLADIREEIAKLGDDEVSSDDSVDHITKKIA